MKAYSKPELINHGMVAPVSVFIVRLKCFADFLFNAFGL